MRRTRYEADHEAFRQSVRAFMQREVAPHHSEWEQRGLVDRSIWLEAGKRGFLGFEVPEEFGGGGVRDFRYNAVLAEEALAIGATGLGFLLHTDVVLPY